MTYKFDRGVPRDHENWEKLFDFMDQNEFTPLDFLACTCAKFCKHRAKEFKTELMVGGQIFKINITKK